MAHQLWHKREPQLATSIPSSIGFSTISQLPTGGGLATDTAITTLTRVLTFVTSPVGTQTGSLAVTTQTITVANSAELATLTSLPPTSTVVVGNGHSSSPTSTTSPSSTSTSKPSSSNGVSATLIVAIVVPIAVILLLSLVLFWFFMRKKHQRLLSTQAEFVMAGAPHHRGEKLPSRGGSSGSSSSSIPMSENPEKKTSTTTVRDLDSIGKEMPVSPPTLPQPTFSTNEIGVARPLTPQDSKGPQSPRRPPKSSDKGGYRNFSGPATNPATRRGPPPTQKQLSGHTGNRQRSNTTNSARDPSPLFNGPNPAVRSDRMHGPPRSGPAPRQPIPPSAWRGPRGPPRNDNGFPGARDGPSPQFNGRRASPQAPLSPTLGAFNGASPISQYSPIIKDGAGDKPPVANQPVASAPLERPTPAPLALDVIKPSSTNSSRATSPLPKDLLSQENLRIARLGLSYTNTTTTSPVTQNFSKKPNNLTSTAHVSTLSSEPSPALSSPRLPPPRGYSPEPEEEPEDSIHQAVTQRRSPEPSANSHIDDRHLSTISAPSDDGYEDIDAKSDVSSLHEDFDHKRSKKGRW